jgi:hypothetical protein
MTDNYNGPQYAGSVSIPLDDDDITFFLDYILGLEAEGRALLLGHDLWVNEEEAPEIRDYIGVMEDDI